MREAVHASFDICALRGKGRSSMKKVICKVEYDTEASELIQKKVSAYSVIRKAMKSLFIRRRTASSSSTVSAVPNLPIPKRPSSVWQPIRPRPGRKLNPSGKKQPGEPFPRLLFFVCFLFRCGNHTIPWAFIASTTFSKPAMLAPTT